MRLFYQSFGVSRGSRDGHYGQVLKKILDQAAAPGTEISIYGLSPHRAIAEQYRYLEFLDKADVMDNGLQAEREDYDDPKRSLVRALIPPLPTFNFPSQTAGGRPKGASQAS
jgi:hypothetical protein